MEVLRSTVERRSRSRERSVSPSKGREGLSPPRTATSANDADEPSSEALVEMSPIKGFSAPPRQSAWPPAGSSVGNPQQPPSRAPRFTEPRDGPGENHAEARAAMADRMMQAAKADESYVAPKSEHQFVTLAREAGHLKRKMDAQRRKDAAEAVKMDEMRSLPKWKQEAAAAKKAAAEKKRRSQLTKEQQRELAAQEAAQRKADVIRMKTIARQMEAEKEEA